MRGPGTDARAQRQCRGDTRDQGQRRQPVRPMQRSQVRVGPVQDTKAASAQRRSGGEVRHLLTEGRGSRRPVTAKSSPATIAAFI